MRPPIRVTNTVLKPTWLARRPASQGAWDALATLICCGGVEAGDIELILSFDCDTGYELTDGAAADTDDEDDGSTSAWRRAAARDRAEVIRVRQSSHAAAATTLL